MPESVELPATRFGEPASIHVAASTFGRSALYLDFALGDNKGFGHFTVDEAKALVDAISDVIEAKTPKPFEPKVGDFVRVATDRYGTSAAKGKVGRVAATGPGSFVRVQIEGSAGGDGNLDRAWSFDATDLAPFDA